VLKQMVCVVGMLLLAATACGTSGDAAQTPAELFPDLDGWTRDGEPAIYTAETLFDYINGGADLYIAYDFEELATLSYDSDANKSITIDIYRHSTPNNGFGIYSQEKSTGGAFLPIGAQGYYDPGVLNFFTGRYYVKIMAYGLGDDEVHFLTSLAQTISEKLGGTAEMPRPVACLPEKARLDKSERYIAQDFLGHSFLHSAFIADYEVLRANRSIPFQVFIIEAVDEADAQTMIAKYREHAGSDPPPDWDKTKLIQLTDPYYKSKGTLNMMTKGKYIWGLFGDDPAIYMPYLQETGNLLAQAGLIEI
jgi:hypothetical protein